MFPILRRYSETLSLSYVASRTIEATIGLDFKLSMKDAKTGKKAVSIPKAAPPEMPPTVIAPIEIPLPPFDASSLPVDVASYQGELVYDAKSLKLVSASFPQGVSGAVFEANPGKLRFVGTADGGLGGTLGFGCHRTGVVGVAIWYAWMSSAASGLMGTRASRPGTETKSSFESFSITPTGSWPMVRPGATGYSPFRMWTSVPQMPATSIFISAASSACSGLAHGREPMN